MLRRNPGNPYDSNAVKARRGRGSVICRPVHALRGRRGGAAISRFPKQLFTFLAILLVVIIRIQIVDVSRRITTIGAISPPKWLRKQPCLRNQLVSLRWGRRADFGPIFKHFFDEVEFKTGLAFKSPSMGPGLRRRTSMFWYEFACLFLYRFAPAGFMLAVRC